MITFPPAKINLGLNVVERRPDGYHNLETVFYALTSLHDVLEVVPMDERFPSASDCDLKVTGLPVEGDEQRNLVVRAYQLLKAERPSLPRVHVHLCKNIPSQAGMGGGSSDGASMLMLLNEGYSLGYSREELMRKAAMLGADCPFFLVGGAAYGEGIGERLTPVDLSLSGWHLAVVRPNTPVSTREAFSLIRPCKPDVNCFDVVRCPVDTWRGALVNDFEASVFTLHPDIRRVKEHLDEIGAVYSAMSGSGSAVFGLFRDNIELEPHFAGMFVRMLQL